MSSIFEQITLSVGALMALTILLSIQAFNDPGLRERLIFHPASIKSRGEYYRFLTHGFIHGDAGHLFLNMWALLIFGPTAEHIFQEYMFDSQLVGRIAFLAFYLIAIVVAAIPTYFRHQDHYGYRALGASGAVSAVMWPYILLAPWNWFIFPPLPAILVGIGYIAYSHYADKRGGSRVGHNAHLWGAIFGLAVYVGLLAYFRPELLELFWAQLLHPQGPF